MIFNFSTFELHYCNSALGSHLDLRLALLHVNHFFFLPTCDFRCCVTFVMVQVKLMSAILCVTLTCLILSTSPRDARDDLKACFLFTDYMKKAF